MSYLAWCDTNQLTCSCFSCTQIRIWDMKTECWHLHPVGDLETPTLLITCKYMFPYLGAYQEFTCSISLSSTFDYCLLRDYSSLFDQRFDLMPYQTELQVLINAHWERKICFLFSSHSARRCKSMAGEKWVRGVSLFTDKARSWSVSPLVIEQAFLIYLDDRYWSKMRQSTGEFSRAAGRSKLYNE